MSVDYTPTRGNYTSLSPFRFWCNKVLPLVYDDSLSYYELLCKVVDYLNKTMEDVETLEGDITSMYDAYEQLQTYVNTYFDNLDVQEEINNKLDDLAEDGTLSNILLELYGNNIGVKVVDNISDMTNEETLYVLSSDTDGYIYGWNGTEFVVTSTKYTNPINLMSFKSANDIVDADNLYRGTYRIDTDSLANWSNIPSTDVGIIIRSYDSDSNSCVQIANTFQNYSDPEFYIRMKSSGTWSGWFDISDKITEDSFKLREIGNITDADDFEVGIYYIPSDELENISNLPTTSSGIIVLSYEIHANSGYQIALDFAGTHNYLLTWARHKSSGVWSNWLIENDIAYLVPTRIYTGDANNFGVGSLYYTTPSNEVVVDNVPYKRIGGLIKTYGFTDRNAKLQTFECWGNNYYDLYAIRNTQNGSTWSEWKTIRDTPTLPHYGFTVITDSLGSGYTMNNAGSSGQEYYELSWPAYLSRKLGCKCFICGAGGESTVDWLASDTYGYLGMWERIPTTPIYIITLGTNDANQSVAEATFKENYRDIISAIKAKNSNAIILCMRLWRTNTPWSTYDGYLQSVLSEYDADDNVFELNINSAVNSEPIRLHLWRGHYDPIGYKLIADAVESGIVSIANSNPDKFRQTYCNMITSNPNKNKGYPYAY